MKTYNILRFVLPGCIGLLSNLFAASQPKLNYGISAMTLGEAVKTAPTINTPFDRWATSLQLDRFYKAGGETGSVTRTQSRLAWTDDTLYILFRCHEPNMNHPGHVRQFKLADNIDNSFLLDTYFQDRVDVYIRPAMTSSHFYQFSVAKDGQSAGVIRGELTQVKNPEGGGDVIKDRSARLITRFKSEIKAEKDAWTVLLKLPWSSIEGKPLKPFGLLPSRTRWRNSERTSPVTLDFDDRPAPDLFYRNNIGR